MENIIYSLTNLNKSKSPLNFFASLMLKEMSELQSNFFAAKLGAVKVYIKSQSIKSVM